MDSKKSKVVYFLIVLVIGLLITYIFKNINFSALKIFFDSNFMWYAEVWAPIIAACIAFCGVSLSVWASTRNQLKKKEIEYKNDEFNKKQNEEKKIRDLVLSIHTSIIQFKTLYQDAIKLEVRMQDHGFEQTDDFDSVTKIDIVKIESELKQLQMDLNNDAYAIQTILWGKSFQSNILVLSKTISTGMNLISMIIEPIPMAHKGNLEIPFFSEEEGSILLTKQSVSEYIDDLDKELERIIKKISE